MHFHFFIMKLLLTKSSIFFKLNGLGLFNSNITLHLVTLKFLFILATRKHIITEQNSEILTGAHLETEKYNFK